MLHTSKFQNIFKINFNLLIKHTELKFSEPMSLSSTFDLLLFIYTFIKFGLRFTTLYDVFYDAIALNSQKTQLPNIINKKHSIEVTCKDFTKPHNGEQIFGPQAGTCESIEI